MKKKLAIILTFIFLFIHTLTHTHTRTDIHWFCGGVCEPLQADWYLRCRDNGGVQGSQLLRATTTYVSLNQLRIKSRM